MKIKKRYILAIIILILLIIVFICQKDIAKIFYPKKYNEIVEKYSDKYNIDKDLIFAVIKTESNFNANAISNKGAVGLMQIMEETAYDTAENAGVELNGDLQEILLNPDNNINIGTKYLSELYDKYNSLELALTAYNAGGGNVDKWIEDGTIKLDGSDIENVPYKETNNYVRNILRDYKIYKEIY